MRYLTVVAIALLGLTSIGCSDIALPQPSATVRVYNDLCVRMRIFADRTPLRPDIGCRSYRDYRIPVGNNGRSVDIEAQNLNNGHLSTRYYPLILYPNGFKEIRFGCYEFGYYC